MQPQAVRDLLQAGLLQGFPVSPPGTRHPRWRIPVEAVEAYERVAAAATGTADPPTTTGSGDP